MARMIDLHMHSTHSDGSRTPKELVDLAKEKGIEYLSLSDHDTVDGVLEAKEYARAKGIKVYSAIELSCFDKKDTHILGYCIDVDNSKLKNALDALKQARKDRAKQMIKKLQEGGIDICEQDVIAGSEVIGRPHIAAAMLKKGYGKDVRDIFQRYIGHGCKYYIPYSKMKVEEGIELINNAGGFAVLAHPKLLRYNTYDMTALVKKYKDAGLLGLEVYYPCHYESDVKFFTKLCLKENLVMTVGGDYHNDKDKTKSTMGFSLDLPHLNNTIKFFDEFEAKK